MLTKQQVFSCERGEEEEVSTVRSNGSHLVDFSTSSSTSGNRGMERSKEEQFSMINLERRGNFTLPSTSLNTRRLHHPLSLFKLLSRSSFKDRKSTGADGSSSEIYSKSAISSRTKTLRRGKFSRGRCVHFGHLHKKNLTRLV
ncbi:LOW QUALITY PROTEIN: hypothetical protein TorRG33x02_354530 [Trema orientale]|uniref:Uncharacterized protein n=1 Tax=Trema orientale TaxID=63057 RepID=A0A2P5AB09_TREOI|nr:LOW QUALITY PROTEIN: hypothetical protein TorRG33x02_354530 [Trema orientale]